MNLIYNNGNKKHKFKRERAIYYQQKKNFYLLPIQKKVKVGNSGEGLNEVEFAKSLKKL